jgi:transcription elongation GreA/GreB family factor
MRRVILSVITAVSFLGTKAQDTSKVNPRPLTLQEYNKAKTFTVKDLDKDTYVKFDNSYILDRYELRKPYFITGDDGLKKRIDLYKLIAKDGMQELGTLIYYTNEKGKQYSALQPNFTANAKVWEKYFEDIHSIEKEEKSFVLKLSYILSKEMSFQLYKALNNRKDMKKEAGTYGSDICFPGEMLVAMADGTEKPLEQITAGDIILTTDPITKQATRAAVKELTEHAAKNYALTTLLVIASKESGNEIELTTKLLKATPNHPMVTTSSQKKMSEITIGDEVLCLDEKTNTYQPFKVFSKMEAAGGNQKVYNMVVNTGTTFIVNGVVVMQK